MELYIHLHPEGTCQPCQIQSSVLLILWKKKDRVLSRKNIRDPPDINVEYYPNPKKIIPAKERIKPSQHVPMLPLPPTGTAEKAALVLSRAK